MKAFGTARLGSDMELRYLTDGTAVGQVSLAVRLGIKDKQSGEYKTQWISASLFGKRAESLAPMLTKGSLHAFHLRDIHMDEYTKDGANRYSMKATIEDVELCGKQQGEQSEPRQAPSAKTAQPAAKGGAFSDMDSDVPFIWHGARGAGVDWRAL